MRSVSGLGQRAANSRRAKISSPGHAAARCRRGRANGRPVASQTGLGQPAIADGERGIACVGPVLGTPGVFEEPSVFGLEKHR